MITLQQVSYYHPDKDILFSEVNFSVNRQEKVGLIGNNGCGKSTLLKIITGDSQIVEGARSVQSIPYYVPQVYGQFDHLTIAQVLGVDLKVNALKQILAGSPAVEHFDVLENDWSVEERCYAAMETWGLSGFKLEDKLANLSGGQKTKVFLSGIAVHQPDLVLMDEPTNHLDGPARSQLLDVVTHTAMTLVVVTHDRTILNALPKICELTPSGIRTYGGNYEFYVEQKQIERSALDNDILSKEKMLREYREKERETLERKQKLDARGKRKQAQAGLPKIVMNTLRNAAEASTAKIRRVHADRVNGVARGLQELRNAIPDIDKMKFDFDNPSLHKGKILIKAADINFSYGEHPMWAVGLRFQISSGERLAICGNNGAGKTTLIRMLLGDLVPSTGEILTAEYSSVYIDQDYSLIENSVSVFEQARAFNPQLPEHEVGTRLNRFLFPRVEWSKPCSVLSGGERMRLALCCLTICTKAPDLVFLDEPTNNLDIQNVEILTKALNKYKGTLVVISHDELFLQRIEISRRINLSGI